MVAFSSFGAEELFFLFLVVMVVVVSLANSVQEVFFVVMPVKSFYGGNGNGDARRHFYVFVLFLVAALTVGRG